MEEDNSHNRLWAWSGRVKWKWLWLQFSVLLFSFLLPNNFLFDVYLALYFLLSWFPLLFSKAKLLGLSVSSLSLSNSEFWSHLDFVAQCFTVSFRFTLFKYYVLQTCFHLLHNLILKFLNYQNGFLIFCCSCCNPKKHSTHVFITTSSIIFITIITRTCRNLNKIFHNSNFRICTPPLHHIFRRNSSNVSSIKNLQCMTTQNANKIKFFTTTFELTTTCIKSQRMLIGFAVCIHIILGCCSYISNMLDIQIPSQPKFLLKHFINYWCIYIDFAACFIIPTGRCNQCWCALACFEIFF